MPRDGAVFVGRGKFTADIPPNEFEKDNVRRLLAAMRSSQTSKTAVLRSAMTLRTSRRATNPRTGG